MAKLSSIAAIRAHFFSPNTAKEKGKFPAKPSDKEDKSLSCTNSVLPTGDSVPEALRALGTAGLKLSAALLKALAENPEFTATPSGAVGSDDSLYVAYLVLRGVPEGFVPARSTEEYRENVFRVLLLASEVLSYESEPGEYSAVKVPNTMAHAGVLAVQYAKRRKLAADKVERDQAEEARKAEKEAQERRDVREAGERAEAEAQEALRVKAELEEKERETNQLLGAQRNAQHNATAGAGTNGRKPAKVK